MVRRCWRRFLDWLLPGSVLPFRLNDDWPLDDGDQLTGPEGVRRDVLPDLPDRPRTMTDTRGYGAR